MEWCLTVTGYNEIFENGVPSSSFDYYSYFTFSSFEEALSFMKIMQQHSDQYLKYELQTL